jgi:hypothetical protein
MTAFPPLRKVDLIAMSSAIAMVLSFSFGCFSMLNPSHDYEDVTRKRASDQVHFADSLKVFFVDYVNPYPDREILWFSSFLEGSVTMEVHDAASDSLEAIYHFEPQETPLYAVAHRTNSPRLVKCVILVANEAKCAKLLPVFYPLHHPQWGTEYRVEERK